MIDPTGLFFIILIFAPFLLIVIPTLLCYGLVLCCRKLFHLFNRLVARLCGSDGWCSMGYLFNRTYMGRNPISAWWHAFMFKRGDV